MKDLLLVVFYLVLYFLALGLVAWLFPEHPWIVLLMCFLALLFADKL